MVAREVGATNLSARQGLVSIIAGNAPVSNQGNLRVQSDLSTDRLGLERMKTAKERPRDGISQLGGGGRAGPALRLSGGPRAPHGVW